ncbi:MAG: DUF4062 domain-containing protein [candidate division Zixibacteria bacterium]|nr:DUF4062 domain-containing protein [candidate division Zixibacteria bacterium]
MNHIEQIKVFLSSTKTDLQAERKAVESAIRRMQIPFIGMEYFGSNEQSPIDVCINGLKESSIYIGIIGFKYGSFVPGTDISFTQYEYDTAGKLGLPRLIYLKSEEAKLSYKDVEHDELLRNKMLNFRSNSESAHASSEFSDSNDLAAMVTADLFNLLYQRKERSLIVSETDIFQMPRVIIKRAEMTLLDVRKMLEKVHRAERNGTLSKQDSRQMAVDFFRNYRFNYDGEFTVFNSERITVFHQFQHMIGKIFFFIDVNFEPIFNYLLENKGEGTLKWIDNLSSDYLLSNEVFYSQQGSKEWIRFNIAPFLYFEPWDWFVLVESHNEIHGLSSTEIQDIHKEFRNKQGWVII